MTTTRRKAKRREFATAVILGWLCGKSAVTVPEIRKGVEPALGWKSDRMVAYALQWPELASHVKTWTHSSGAHGRHRFVEAKR